jgi:hypothetical protein
VSDYDGLWLKEIEDLIHHPALQDMADGLARLGYADDVARETQELLLDLRAAVNRCETMRARLAPVWRDMERWQDCSTSEATFKARLRLYRGQSFPDKCAECGRPVYNLVPERGPGEKIWAHVNSYRGQHKAQPVPNDEGDV